jgi:hypothetical protein
VRQAAAWKQYLHVALMTVVVAVPTVPGCSQRAANTRGVDYDLARERALKLAPLMSQADVQSLLGPPHQTAFQPVGGVPGAVGSMGQLWIYEWKPNGAETKRLALSFGFVQGRGWLLSSWTWS